ncbi:MAG: hypothetical protein HY906_23055, partial [Deltaproteobacteria bacterium]|nr:hypothetical protein [Deltaproteobacteria bacterium]
ETWVSDGTTWTRVCPTTAGPCNTTPAARQGAYMAPDPNGKLVLFGGCKDQCLSSSDFYDDTWQWDGATSTWQQVPLAVKPQPLAFGAMAFDLGGNQTVLFGGLASSFEYSQATWYWNGAAWIDVCPTGCSPIPAHRSHHAMAYEQANQRVIMYGASQVSGSADTWALKWGGTEYAWSQISGATQPGLRYGHTMASDPSGSAPLLLFGGVSGSVPLNDTWGWNGSGWTQLTTTGQPPEPRLGASLAFLGGSGGGFFLWGGAVESDGSGYGDTWKIGITQQWEQLGMGPRYGHGAAYDPLSKTTLMFGGYDGALRSDLWAWDGAIWRRRMPPSAPPPVSFAAVGLQENNSRLVVVNGGDPFNILATAQAESWVCDLATNAWTRECQGSACPFPWLIGATMAYDSGRDCLVMHGGVNGSMTATDRIFERCNSGGTYVWQEACTSGSCQSGKPAARAFHAAAYDRTRQRTVFFGGCYGACNQAYETLAETWEWDGTQWHAGPAGPSAMRGHALSYDTRRRKVMLLGGRAADGTLEPILYEYDGTAWSGGSDATGAAGREAPAMAYDRERGVTVLHAGAKDPYYVGDTWEHVGWGGACTTNVDCDDGFPCVTGFCCSSQCPGQCQVCAMSWGSVQDGVCGDAIHGFPGNPPCAGGYVCGGGGQACLTGCNGDADCQGGFYCGNSGTCVAVKLQGAGCPDSACRFPPCRQCGARPCVDGVCCESECSGLCERCEMGSGMCRPVPDGQEDANECVDGTADPTCGRSVCNGVRTCRYASTSTSCGSQTCTNGTLRLVSTCDGVGGCSPAQTQGCSGFACSTSDPTKCGTTCVPNTGTGCVAGFTCNAAGNACEGGKNPGETCTADGECHSNYCAGGRCCTGECQDADPSCGGSCNTTGVCSYPGASKTCTCGTTAGHCAGDGLCDCVQHDGGVTDGGAPDGGAPDGPPQDAAGTDAPPGDGAASDAVGPQQDGPGPQPDGGGKTGTTSFLGCSAAPAAGSGTLPLLVLALALGVRRRRD